MVIAIGQVLILVLVPILATWGSTRSRIVRAMSPVVLCWAAGMLLANQRWIPIRTDVSIGVAFAAVVLAVPLLLFSTNVREWLRLAKRTIWATIFAFGTVTAVGAVASILFRRSVPQSWEISGMLIGSFTGGAANMAAIGAALQVTPERFLTTVAADVLVGTIYFFFLISLAPRILARFLRPFEKAAEKEVRETCAGPVRATARLAGVGLAVATAALGAGIAWIAPAGSRDVVAVLAVTTLAIAASCIRPIRRLPGTYESGQFLLLVFCAGVGSLANFRALLAASPVIPLFAAFMLVLSVGLHYVLCAVFRIDRDTAVITSTAAIFSPAMVGIIADRLKNREVVVSGVTAALVGFAAGNYLGLGVAFLLRRML